MHFGRSQGRSNNSKLSVSIAGCKTMPNKDSTADSQRLGHILSNFNYPTSEYLAIRLLLGSLCAESAEKHFRKLSFSLSRGMLDKCRLASAFKGCKLRTHFSMSLWCCPVTPPNMTIHQSDAIAVQWNRTQYARKQLLCDQNGNSLAPHTANQGHGQTLVKCDANTIEFCKSNEIFSVASIVLQKEFCCALR